MEYFNKYAIKKYIYRYETEQLKKENKLKKNTEERKNYFFYNFIIYQRHIL